MGGNHRHAEKGPDRQTSECKDCHKKFEHRKFSHPKYCPECREDRQERAELETSVEISRSAPDKFTVDVNITNNNDVNVKIPVKHVNEPLVGIFGHIRVVGGEFEAENAIIDRFEYSFREIRRNSEINYVFEWDNNNLEQQNKPRLKDKGVIGENLREKVAMTKGDPQKETELAVRFSPVKDNTDYMQEVYDGTS